MLKTRKKADFPSPQNLPLVWDDNPDAGRKKSVTLQTFVPSKEEPKPEHDETAEDAVNALLGNGEAETPIINLPPSLRSKSTPSASPQPPPQPQEAPKEPPQDEKDTAKAEEPEGEAEDDASAVLEISDDESLGDALTRLRSSLNQTIQDLAGKTKIPAVKIKALEEGQYDEITDFNIGKDYVRKLCLEYLVPADKYIQKFSEEYHREIPDDPLPHFAGTPSGTEAIDTSKKSNFVSIPSLMIGTLIVILILLVLGGLIKLFIKGETSKTPVNMSELVPITREPMTTLPMQEEN